MSRASVFTALVFTACEPSVAFERYCAELTNAQCLAAQRCGTLSRSIDCGKPYVVTGDCLGPYQEAFVARTLRYDGVNAKKCVDATREASCSSVGVPERCWSVAVGTGKEGEPCGTCGEGLYCLRAGAASCGTCAVREPEPQRMLPKRGEACTSPLADGEGCVADSWCQSNVCVARAEVGEACGVCVLGASCLDGVCVADAEAGESCVERRCFNGLSCIDGTCVVRTPIGAFCAQDAECVSLRCLDGLCAVGRAAGSACDERAPCQPELHCVDARCAPLPAHGGACSGVCAGLGSCVEGVCVDPTLQVCR